MAYRDDHHRRDGDHDDDGDDGDGSDSDDDDDDEEDEDEDEDDDDDGRWKWVVTVTDGLMMAGRWNLSVMDCPTMEVISTQGKTCPFWRGFWRG